MIELQSNPDGPDFFQLQWRLLTEQFPFVHGIARPSVFATVSMNCSFVEEKELHVYLR